ncbi:putative WD repeat-containing protein 67 [Cardiosporidium cionae]|uniref:WD repeat-containing protein 67 n=1 Tax=Cardiosporidium cionae TaxID=476202 RepID=A0ABQ7J9W0_9APIC|nr:putative WD repeat-containing protein 67 [Cardiosporidium cionae]|eukprot:KAF8820781.1 putative WD repeat-containing protein 67 [Cardiosporidium cionae]
MNDFKRAFAYINMEKEQTLNVRHGRLWESKPTMSKDGLLTAFVNGKRPHVGSMSPYQFVCVSFNEDGKIAALADTRGHVFLLFIGDNRYSEISCAQKTVTALAFTKTTEIELMIASFKRIEVYSIQMQSNVATLQSHAGPVLFLDATFG